MPHIMYACNYCCQQQTFKCIKKVILCKTNYYSGACCFGIFFIYFCKPLKIELNNLKEIEAVMLTFLSTFLKSMHKLLLNIIKVIIRKNEMHVTV